VETLLTTIQNNSFMTKPQLFSASIAVLLASASSSHAATVTVQNPSFELPGGGGGQYPPATSWEGSSFTELSADVGITGGDGPRHNGQNSGSTANQDLGVAFLPDYVYTLTIAIGNRTSDSNNPTGVASFGLTADGTEVGVFTQAVSAPNTFQDFVYAFTTGALAPDGNIGIRLAATGGRGLFDNVRLDATPVPEPSTALCALIGGSLIIARRRRS
jgi:hypothetical protein